MNAYDKAVTSIDKLIELEKRKVDTMLEMKRSLMTLNVWPEAKEFFPVRCHTLSRWGVNGIKRGLYIASANLQSADGRVRELTRDEYQYLHPDVFLHREFK
jgi:hypothetical protein